MTKRMLCIERLLQDELFKPSHSASVKRLMNKKDYFAILNESNGSYKFGYHLTFKKSRLKMYRNSQH
jgi:hypothetical protein